MGFAVRASTFHQVLLLCLAWSGLSGCTGIPSREAPLGHACHRLFAYDAAPRRYACLFELSAPSAFYEDAEVDRVIEGVMAREGGRCRRLPERQIVAEGDEGMDHGLRYRRVELVCE